MHYKSDHHHHHQRSSTALQHWDQCSAFKVLSDPSITPSIGLSRDEVFRAETLPNGCPNDVDEYSVMLAYDAAITSKQSCWVRGEIKH